MNIWILYGLSGSGKSTFMEQYKKNNPDINIISRDIALMFDLHTIGYHKKDFKSKVVEIVNEIKDNNNCDIIGIEIPISEYAFMDCDNYLYTWIKDVEKDFDNIYIHMFKQKIYDDSTRKILSLSPKISIIKHNSFDIFNHDLSRNTMSNFDELFKNFITTQKYIEFKKVLGYPDFIQLSERNVGREGKCYTDNYESSYWETCDDYIDDDSDKIWNNLFELLKIGNYEMKNMHPIEWKIFEKNAIFETREHYGDYYETGTRYITYLSLPNIFKIVENQN